MEESKINITASISNSISYVTRQCEIYLANKYHKKKRIKKQYVINKQK